jgi:predicted ATPase
MRFEGVTEDDLKRALSSILAARSIESSALLQLEVVTARVGQARVEAREREYALAEVLVRLARAELLRFRGNAADADAAPRFEGDPRAAIAFDFQCGSVEQEAWSCLYYRYLAAIPLPVQDIAAVVQPGSPHGRRLVSRRLARGYALLHRALRKMEQQSLADRAEGTSAPGSDPAAQDLKSAPPPSRPHTASRLPNPLGSFVGREAQLSALREHLRNARLVTLVGPGGVGKTRLSLHVAAEQARTLGDAAAFVDLTSITDGARLPREIAKAIGIRSAKPGQETDVAIEVFLDRPWLLLLDNCEHLVEDVARVARTLLEAAPSLRILATSREALAIPGEQVAPIPPLSLPAAAPDSPSEPSSSSHRDASESEAVRLFVERARSAQPTFALDADNLPAVVTICRRLDGLPLAIELAASRVRLLTPAEIARRLDRLFLAGGVLPRATDQRQQTLWGAIEWSHELLSEPERAAFRRLAVFPGRFGFDAAQAVIVSHEDPPELAESSEEILDQLVSKSLLRAVPEGGRTRLRMLETIRAYASTQLEAAGETEATRDHLLAWCAALLREAGPKLLGAEQLPWLDRIDKSFETLSAAVEHALRRGGEQRQAAARIVCDLDMYGLYRGRGVEMSAWLEALLADPKAYEPRRLARLELAATVVAIADKRSADAQRHAEAALAAYLELGDEKGENRARYLLATALNHQSLDDEATREAERALDAFRAQGDLRMVGRSLGLLSGILADKQDLEASLAMIDESIEILQRHGNPHDHAIGVHNRATILHYTNRTEEACRQMEENRDRYARIGSLPGVALSDANLGVTYEDLGRYADAREAYARAEGYYRDQGNVCMRAIVKANMVTLARLEGQEADLLPLAMESLRLAARCGTDRVRVLALAVTSRCALDDGRPRLAIRLRAATRRLITRLGPALADKDFVEEQLPTNDALDGLLDAAELQRLEEEADATALDALIEHLAAGNAP